MLKIIFRILMLGLGVFFTYSFGSDAIKPILYRTSGVSVEGRISGFLAGRNTPSIQREPDGVRKGKRKARRPAFIYPSATGAVDSLEGRSSTSTFFTFTNYELHEHVTVVFEKSNPSNAYIFGWQLITVAMLLALFGLFMIWLGFGGKL